MLYLDSDRGRVHGCDRGPADRVVRRGPRRVPDRDADQLVAGCAAVAAGRARDGPDAAGTVEGSREWVARLPHPADLARDHVDPVLGVGREAPGVRERQRPDAPAGLAGLLPAVVQGWCSRARARDVRRTGRQHRNHLRQHAAHRPRQGRRRGPGGQPRRHGRRTPRTTSNSTTYGAVTYGAVGWVEPPRKEIRVTDKLVTNLLHELEPVVEQNLERHLAITKDWNPHDYVPWSEGRDFAFLGGEDWSPEQSRLDPVAKAAMITNLLTEDNLPSYHREIATRFGRDGAWGTWVGRWTAEENRHGIAMRDYLVVTRGVDPVELERARMDYMTSGYDSGDKTPLEAVTYVSFQELATRVSHRNTGKVTRDPIADRMLARISKDENLHMVFYRNIVAAA